MCSKVRSNLLDIVVLNCILIPPSNCVPLCTMTSDNLEICIYEDWEV
jgi:hypothetical protein